MSSSQQIPSEPPPSYEDAAGSSSSAAGRSSGNAQTSSRLQVPGAGKKRSDIPLEARRSMEDEMRPLPDGWLRQYDAETGHQFFVDTKANPPRSIWQHPYDDEQYLETLPSEERERLQEVHSHHADFMAESSDDDHHQAPSKPAAAAAAAAPAKSSAAAPAELPPREDQPKGMKKFGRKMKDKFTDSTHEQREAERKKREAEDAEAYKVHLAFRRALQKAVETGEPQYVGKDPQGKDVYVVPPGGMQSSYGPGGRIIDPYSRGPYANPNARFFRPQTPYARPYGYGYGGGLGMPLAAGLGGGMLLGGMLGGSLLF